VRSAALFGLAVTLGAPAAALAEAGPAAWTAGEAHSADGLAVRFATAGDGGTALVLIHGGLADRSVWVEQAPLAATFRLVALDLGGHGASGANREAWSLAALGQDVAAVLDRLDLRRAVLVGSSLGGPVALEAARLRPARVAAVIGVDTLHDPERPPDPAAWRAYVEGFRADFAAACARMVAQLFHPDAPAGLRDETRRRACGAAPEVTRALLDSFTGYDMAAALRAVDAPLRLIQGDLFPTNLPAVRRAHADAEAVVLPHTGHFPMLERPAEFNRRLAAWAVDLAAPVDATTPPLPPERFAYDASRPLDPRFEEVERADGAVLLAGSYAGATGDRVTAYLVIPEAPGTHPAVLFGHWGGGNRTEFLPEALLYARAGVVSLLPDYPWTRPAPSRRALAHSSDPEHDLPIYVQAVTDLRRGLDLLQARPDVDPRRLAYVGHSYGAQWGAILAAVDRRPRAYVLAAGVPDLEALYRDSDDPDFAELRREHPERVERLLRVMAPLAAARHVGRAFPAPLLFQFARHDQAFSVAAMERYFAAARAPKDLAWYPTGHDLNDPQALADRAAWLAPRLGAPELAHVAAAGARARPEPRGRVAAEEVLATELRFAARAGEVNARDAFVEFFADDAVGFHPDLVPAVRAAYAAGPAWSSDFQWWPVEIGVSADGRLAWSTGPVERRAHRDDPAPAHACFLSIWRRADVDGWRVVADIGVDVPEAAGRREDPVTFKLPAAAPLPAAAGSPTAADALLAASPGAGPRGTAQGFRLHVPGLPSRLSLAEARALLGAEPCRFEPAGEVVAGSGDLAATWGRGSGCYRLPGGAARFSYLRVWRRDAGGDWRVQAEVVHTPREGE